MRANEFPDPSQYVTFEVTAPKGAEDAVAALRGLTTALGLSVRQRPALAADLDNHLLPESWQIQEEHFIETSRELWGSDDYGISVASHLQDINYRKRFPLWANGMISTAIPETLQNTEVAGAPFIPLWRGDEMQPKNTGYNLTDQELLTRARILWDHYHLPFTLVTEIFAKDSTGYGRVDLSSGTMTRERLADHMRTNGRDKHNLHGALGKMLDTMCVVAGAIDKEAVGERDVDAEFVEASEFEDMLATSGLNKRATNDIRKRASRAVSEQLFSGNPYEHGEVVVEGKVNDWQYDRIAASSFAALARGYKNQKAPGAQFLRQIS